MGEDAADDTGTDSHSTGESSGSPSTTTGTSAADGSGSSTEASPGSSGASSDSTTDASSGSSSGSGSGNGSDDFGDTGWYCTDDYDPVCGVDGKTYDHPCTAIAAGVEIKREGPCFGDCANSCSVADSPLTVTVALAAALLLRTRRR